jgi:hypothetical protein
MFQHFLLGNTLLLCILFLVKPYFYTQQNLDDIDHEIKKWFYDD